MNLLQHLNSEELLWNNDPWSEFVSRFVLVTVLSFVMLKRMANTLYKILIDLKFFYSINR